MEKNRAYLLALAELHKAKLAYDAAMKTANEAMEAAKLENEDVCSSLWLAASLKD